MNWKLAQIKQPNFVEHRLKTGPTKGPVSIQLADKSITMPFRHAIMHVMMWKPYFTFNIDPTTSDIVNLYKTNRSTTSKMGTKLYHRVLAEKPYINHLEVLREIWMMINTVYNFVVKHGSAYNEMLTLTDLCELRATEPFKELRKKIAIQLDPNDNLGINVLEQRANALDAELINLLNNKQLMGTHCLTSFMETGNLKKVQIPQVLTAYGTRSDTNTTLFKHVVATGALEGVKSTHDWAVEATGAKKAQHNSKRSIQDSQYLHRRLKLVCSPLSKIYVERCESQLTIPYTIPAESAKNYLFKVIVDNGKKVVLTPDVLNTYVDRPIQMVTPTTCRHTDGVCPPCMGLGWDNYHYYLPPNVHLGMFSASKLGEPVSQLILSAKHFVVTFANMYVISPEVSKYIFTHNDGLFFRKTMAKYFNKTYLRVKVCDVDPLTDLTYGELPNGEDYGNISEFQVVFRDSKTNDLVPLVYIDHRNTSTIPYLSDQMIEHMARVYDNITITEDGDYLIPLTGYSAVEPFMQYIITDDDMTKFVKTVDQFFKSKITRYTSIPVALKALTDLLYTKTTIPIFFVEMVMRAYMATSTTDFRIPVVHDVNNVVFVNERTAILNRALSTKLSYEDLNKYFSIPETYTVPKDAGWYDALYGL